MVRNHQVAIAHIVLWITCTCATLGYSQWRLRSSGILETLPDRALYYSAQSFVFGPLNGACYAAALLFCVHLFNRTVRFPSEPGHWLIAIHGANLAVTNLLSEAVQLWWGETPPTMVNYAVLILVFLMTACMAAVASVKLKGASRWWKAAVLSLPLANLGITIHYFVFLSRYYLPAYDAAWVVCLRVIFSLPVLFSMIALGSDASRRRSHDFLHWFGCITIAALTCADWTFLIVDKVLK